MSSALVEKIQKGALISRAFNSSKYRKYINTE
jgi:hypothetical protein